MEHIKELIIKNNLPQSMAQVLFKSLLSFNKTCLQLNKYPQHFIQKLFSSKIEQNCYYPINIIQLRQFLKQKKIINNNKLLFYSFQFSKKYFNQYPILIEIKSSDNSVPFTLVQNQNIKINKIFINQSCVNKNDIQTIKLILKDFNFNNYGTIREIKANSWYSIIKTSAKINQTKLFQVAKRLWFYHYGIIVNNSRPNQSLNEIELRKRNINKINSIMNGTNPNAPNKQQVLSQINDIKNELIKNIGLENPNGDWILNQINSFSSQVQDIPQLQSVIYQFNKIKPKLQKRDLNQYKNYDQLKTAVDSINGSVGKTVNPKLLQQHFTLINKVGEYSLYKANDVEGVKEIGEISGSWCTRGSYGQKCKAEEYFPNGIYQILKGDQLFAQASGNLDQITNLNNNTIDQFDQDLKLLLKSIKSGFINYITYINPNYKLTEQQLNDPEIYNQFRQKITHLLMDGKDQYYNWFNNKFNNKFDLQNIKNDPEIMQKVKKSAIVHFINRDHFDQNTFDDINKIFNGMFDNINKQPKALQMAHKKAIYYIKNMNIQYKERFVKLNNDFNNIFINNQDIIKVAKQEILNHKEDYYLLQTIKDLFGNKIIEDINIYNQFKKKAIQILTYVYTASFKKLNKIFNNKFSQDPELIEKYGKKYPQLFNLQNTVLANNFYNLLKLSDGTFNLGNNTQLKQFTRTQSYPQFDNVNSKFAKPPLQVGDQVTLKTLGYAKQKPVGRVQKVIGNIAYVTWNSPVMSINGKNKKVKTLKTKHDLLDLVGLGISIIKI